MPTAFSGKIRDKQFIRLLWPVSLYWVAVTISDRHNHNYTGVINVPKHSRGISTITTIIQRWLEWREAIYCLKLDTFYYVHRVFFSVQDHREKAHTRSFIYLRYKSQFSTFAFSCPFLLFALFSSAPSSPDDCLTYSERFVISPSSRDLVAISVDDVAVILQ